MAFWLISYLYRIKSAGIALFHLFCRHHVLLMFILMGGYSGLFFKNACAFYPQDFVISIDELSECKAALFAIFLCLPAFFGNSLITLGNQTVRFLSFVYSVFWDSTSYTAISVFEWFQWSALMHPLAGGQEHVSNRNVFLAGEDQKKPWNSWDAYMSLTWCSNAFETKMQEAGCSFFFTSMFWWVYLPKILEWIFIAVFQVLGWIILVLHFEGNDCNWIPKVNWPWMEWFRVFLLQNGFIGWHHISVENNLQDLLFCHLFSRHQNLLMFSSMGVYSGLFVKNACAFYPQDFVISIDKLLECKVALFAIFCDFQPFLETLWLLWGTKLFVFSALFTVSFEILLRILQ